MVDSQFEPAEFTVPAGQVITLNADRLRMASLPKSPASTLYLALRSSKPFALRFGVTDRLSGVTPDSRDRWGYLFVKDFDADRNAPFLLKR